MAQEKVDPMYQYVDRQIKKLKKELLTELQKIQSEQRRQFEITSEDSMDIRRSLAFFIVISTCNLVSENVPKEYDESRFVANTALARERIKTSDDPIAIASKFYNDGLELLDKAGVQIFTYPS